jgi:hypothetical protein
VVVTYDAAADAFSYNFFMWGRIIVGAVLVALVAIWLAALVILFGDPHHWRFTSWPL